MWANGLNRNPKSIAVKQRGRDGDVEVRNCGFTLKREQSRGKGMVPGSYPSERGNPFRRYEFIQILAKLAVQKREAYLI